MEEQSLSSGTFADQHARQHPTTEIESQEDQCLEEDSVFVRQMREADRLRFSGNSLAADPSFSYNPADHDFEMMCETSEEELR